MTKIDYEGVKKILRQRFPILLVDKVTELKLHDSITAIKNVTYNDPCFIYLKENLKLEDISYPCSLIVESFCQAAGILYVLSYDKIHIEADEFIVFGSISNFHFFQPVFPGETMVHQAKLIRGFDNAAIFSGKVLVNNKVVAEVKQVVVAFRKSESLSNSKKKESTTKKTTV